MHLACSGKKAMNRLPMLFSALAFILLASPPCRAADTKTPQANSAAAQKPGEIPQTFPPGPTAREFEQQPVMNGGRLMRRIEKWPQVHSEKECKKSTAAGNIATSGTS
jgi:hypothetical protein